MRHDPPAPPMPMCFRGSGLLTRRQRQVAAFVCQGARGIDIAQELGISPGTVEAHRQHIFYRLGVRCSEGIARVVFRGY